jgi:hypothetical protein
MEREFQYSRSGDADSAAFTRRAWWVNVVSAAAIVFAVGIGSAVNSMVTGKGAIGMPSPPLSGKMLDPYDVILDALLAPVLEDARVPLRFVDPRAALRCRRYTSVAVNNRPLIAGELVPDGRFDLEWYSDGCHAPGTPDARMDGWVKLTVFRENWGFSAMIEPEGLRITRGDYEYAVVKRGAGALSRCESSERLVATEFQDGEPVPC